VSDDARIEPRAGILGRFMGGGGDRFLELSRDQVRNRVDHVPEMLIFKAGIGLASPADSYDFDCVLEMC
jgi:hypothetical protein